MSDHVAMAMEWMAPVVTGVVGLGGMACTYAVAAAQRKSQLESLKLQLKVAWAKDVVINRDKAYIEYVEALKIPVIAAMGRAKANGDFDWNEPLDKPAALEMLKEARTKREQAWERFRFYLDKPVVDAAERLYQWISGMEQYVMDDPKLNRSWKELWDEYQERRDALNDIARKSSMMTSILSEELSGSASNGGSMPTA
ncbi:hypothetical protein AB0M02_44735 [Actinoplanes sp. NPDC051861]|uniref:hypothetical protein n=1 Tax=Actinoplanes sp. NPDC051861 TaxID=3155170 RepID=UPI00343E06ED